MEIRKHFDDYIKEKNITTDFESELQKIGYITFFNDITTRCLGDVTFTHEKYHETSSSMVYVPDSVKETLIPSLDMVYVSQLYFGIMTNGKMDFNYTNYEEFLKDLVYSRVQAKKDAYKDGEKNESAMKAQYLMKIYMNLVYGMLDKPEAILTSGLDEPRKYIVETAKSVMANVVAFYLNKSMPVYYVDTDEIFAPHIDTHTFEKLQEHFKTSCNDLINTEVSNVFIDEDESNNIGIVYGKKKYMVSTKARVIGIPKVKDETVLLQNKKYFGRNFREIFPEYTL
jgi:hypothetical protein